MDLYHASRWIKANKHEEDYQREQYLANHDESRIVGVGVIHKLQILSINWYYWNHWIEVIN